MGEERKWKKNNKRLFKFKMWGKRNKKSQTNIDINFNLKFTLPKKKMMMRAVHPPPFQHRGSRRRKKKKEKKITKEYH